MCCDRSGSCRVVMGCPDGDRAGTADPPHAPRAFHARCPWATSQSCLSDSCCGSPTERSLIPVLVILNTIALLIGLALIVVALRLCRPARSNRHHPISQRMSECPELWDSLICRAGRRPFPGMIESCR
jgi:hypothetical protein